MIVMNNAKFCGDEYFDMTFSLIYKNILSLYTCFKLNIYGLYGEANIIYRNVYENLMIGKFVLLTNSKKTYIRWSEGREIQISKDIINKIQKPNQETFKLFWKDLCQWSHATISSGQILSQNDHESEELKNSICVLKILLIMNYNYLTKNAYNKHNYYMKKYGKDIWNEYKKLKSEFYSLKRKSIRNISDFGIKVIDDFSEVWEI